MSVPLAADAADVASVAIAVVALVISTVVAWLHLWKEFFAKPDIWATGTWMAHGGGVILNFVVVNTGHRQGVVKIVELNSRRFPEVGRWTTAFTVNACPLVLPADSASRAFNIDLDPGGPDMIRDALRTGTDPQLEVVVTEVSPTSEWLGARSKQGLGERETTHQLPPFERA